MPRRTNSPADEGLEAAREEHAAAVQALDQSAQTRELQTAAPEPEPQVNSSGSAPPMKIDVRITSTRNVHGDPVRATATVLFNDVFAVKGVRIVKGKDGLFCDMPARRLNNGTYSTVCNPITKEFAMSLNASVLNEYQVYLAQQMEESQQLPHIYEPEQVQEQSEPAPEAPEPEPVQEMGM